MSNIVSTHNRPQRSCEGYVFTRVCHSVHRGVPGPGGMPVLGGSAPGGGGGCLVPGVSDPGGVCYRGGVVSQHALRQTPPRERRLLPRTRYASHRNAFLLLFFKLNNAHFNLASLNLWSSNV